MTVRGLEPALCLVTALVLGACEGKEGSTTVSAGSVSATDTKNGSISDTDAETSMTGTTDISTDSTTRGALCGNGIVEEREVCDDGINDGSYGSCSPDCKEFGPYCGDGFFDEAHEVCDDGINDGSYDGCGLDCMELGPHCGDGILHPGAERCDDGNSNDNDVCSNSCDADVCTSVTATTSTPNVQLVLDKSGSMVLSTWDADEDPNTPAVTRWGSLHGVLTTVLTDFQAELSFGVTLFPSTAADSAYNEMACVVSPTPEVGCALNNRDAILAAIPAAASTSVHGATPASAGLHAALTHLGGLDPKAPRAIVFITDGAANCPESWNMGDPYEDLLEVYDDALHAIVADAWSNDRIPTYVVGIDISASNTGVANDADPDNVVPHDKLNNLASTGGKPKVGVDKFYNTKSQVELQAALDQIVHNARSCVIAIEPPIIPASIKVELGDDVVPMITDCITDDGWAYTDMTYSVIEICGSWCDQVKTTGMVIVEYFCPIA